MIEMILSNVVLVIVAIAFSAYIVIGAQRNRAVHNYSRELLIQTKQKSENRMKREEELNYRVGSHENKNLFYKMDILLIQSRIKSKIVNLNTEIYFIYLMISSVFIFFVVYYFTFKNVYICLILNVLWVFLNISILKFFAYLNEKNIDEQMIQFANLVKNYNKTQDDLAGILNSIHIYLDEPLKTYIEEFYAEINIPNIGHDPYERLCIKVGNRRFTELIQDLVLSSRYRTNYDQILESYIHTLKSYYTEKKKKKQMNRNGKIVILLTAIVGICGCLLINDKFCNGTLFTNMFSSIQGIAILGFLVFVGIVFVWFLLSFDLGE